MIVFIIIGLISAFIVGYAMVGYPCILKILDKIIRPAKNTQDLSYEPPVTYMIVAHNEDSVIESKLENALELSYPADKFQIIVASDNSTDKTNALVTKFIEMHPERNIILYCSKEHKGKTNAQNEAQKLATGEILVMTDANTMVRPDAIRELVSYFSSDDIVYVSGKLEYSNSEYSATSQSESTYWDIDLSMRDVESRMKTITAGNGALYACRNKDYIDFPPIHCHDIIMPYTYSKMGKRALFNPKAVAVEKAGETDSDEFKRKVRMNRDILTMLKWGFTVMNPFKYGWFSFFYFGHRTCRYLLWLAHILLLISTAVLSFAGGVIGIFGIALTALQLLLFILAGIEMSLKTNAKILHIIGYYGMTVYAQIVGVWRIITGKAKPTWEQAQSTR